MLSISFVLISPPTVPHKWDMLLLVWEAASAKQCCVFKAFLAQ